MVGGTTEADVVETELCELAAQLHAANAQLVRLLARFDELGGWQGVGIRSIGHWAAINLGIEPRVAEAQTRVGRGLPALPAVAAAADVGELGWAKLRLLAQVCEPATEARWLGLAREMSVTQLARVVSAYRRASDTDRADRHSAARERRGIWLFDEPDGLVRITGLLEADDAAILRAALTAHTELLWRQPTPDAPDDEDVSDAEEARSSEVDPTEATREPAASRRVDALVNMAQTALAAGPTPCVGGDRTQVIVHVDADVLAGTAEVGRCHIIGATTPLATDTARRLACDATIRPLISPQARRHPPRRRPSPPPRQPPTTPRSRSPRRRLRLPRLHLHPLRRRPPHPPLGRRRPHRPRQPRPALPPPPPAPPRRRLHHPHDRRPTTLLPARRHPNRPTPTSSRQRPTTTPPHHPPRHQTHTPSPQRRRTPLVPRPRTRRATHRLSTT